MLAHNYTVHQRYMVVVCGDGLLCLFSDNTTDKTNQLNYIGFFFVSATLLTLLQHEPGAKKQEMENSLLFYSNVRLSSIVALANFSSTFSALRSHCYELEAWLM